MTHDNRQGTKEKLTFFIRTVVLLQCLRESAYFQGEHRSKDGQPLTEAEFYIAELLYHFQRGIQYNLHTVYQVCPTK